MKRKHHTQKTVNVKGSLIIDESFTIHQRKGNGLIRRQVWVDDEGEVTRYSLAYINHQIFNGDNGRVLGYDNAHAYHHKHYLGEVSPVAFINFDELEDQFQQEFEVLHAQVKKR